MHKKKTRKKKNKIRLILLEGPSDKLFFESFKKKYCKDKIDVSLLEALGKKFTKINRAIEFSRHLGYKEIWLVMDLKTQKSGTDRY